MKNIIYVENQDRYEFDTIQELYELIFGKEYYNLSEKEQLLRRYNIAFYKINFNSIDLDIVHTKMGRIGDRYKLLGEDFDISRAIVIDNDKEFVKSICRIPNIVILESTAIDGLFTKTEKEKYKGNYIMINDLITQPNDSWL